MTSFLSSCVSWLRFIYGSLIKFTKQLIDPKYWWKLSIYDSEWVQGFKSYAGHCFYGVVARSGYSFTSFGRGTVCYFLVSTCVCVFVCCEIMLKARQKRKLVSCSYCAENNGETDRWGGGKDGYCVCLYWCVLMFVCVCVFCICATLRVWEMDRASQFSISSVTKNTRSSVLKRIRTTLLVFPTMRCCVEEIICLLFDA